MAVLGRGEATGGFSLLNALGLGYGCSLGLDLKVRAMLRDTPPRSPPDDPHGLLAAVEAAWLEVGLELPDEEYYWQIRSEVPSGVGLKSSAGVAVASLRALADATDAELETHQIVDLAARAQLACGCSLTGSIDDAWAAAEPGWKVVDPQLPAAEGVVLAGEFPDPEEWVVFIIERGERSVEIDPNAFAMAAGQFEKALMALQRNALLVALTENGRGVAQATRDTLGRKNSSDALVWGARGAGISGFGPALVVIMPESQDATINRVIEMFESRGFDMIETKVRSE